MIRVPGVVFGACFVLLVINLWFFSSVLQSLSLFPDSDEKHFNATLNKLLIPRWPGSDGHSNVSLFILEELIKLGFYAFRDKITDPVALMNVIGIMNTNAKQFLLLSCHYDSKFLELTENFVGASDGAVPCAILLNLAKNLNFFLRNDFLRQEDIGLVLAFFDGHDSFDGDNDATYPLYGSNKFVKHETVPLKKIKLVISLKFLGAPNIFMSKFENTYYLHERLVYAELLLGRLGKLSKSDQLFYSLKDHYSDIEDDHIPFLEKGVQVMHIVPYTLPEVWHREEDNLKNLHWPTVRNLNAIITQFVYEYLITYDIDLHS